MNKALMVLKLFKITACPILGKAKPFFKGSRKDPFIYLGGILAIIASFAIVGTPTIAVPGNSRDFSLLARASLSVVYSEDRNIARAENLFLGQHQGSAMEAPELVLVGGANLKAVSAPVAVNPQVLGTLAGEEVLSDTRKEVIEYSIEEGDTLSLIADKFGISVNTILWANNLTSKSTLKLGQNLVILPVSGIIHHVKDGDTISGLATKYKSTTDKIVSFNGISNEGDIFIGDILIVPDGVMPAPVQQPTSYQAPLASSYFICPITSPCRVTQGLHWYGAIDFSHGKCGDAIFAAAGGKVLKVNFTNSTSRWAFNGGGNHITILHPNGVVTYYGHLLAAYVNPGDTVSQGQLIALMGGQPGTPGAGKTTGCHLHFGVSGARNPFAK